jgi:hypothetical protein
VTRALTPAEEQFRKERVEHPLQKAVYEATLESLDIARVEPRITVVSGPTGVGKTNLTRRLHYEFVRAFNALAQQQGRLPFVPVTAAPPQHSEFRWPAFFNAILLAANDPFAANPARLRRWQPTSDQLQTAALNVLRYRRPMAFCVDEAQHMTYARRDRTLEQYLDLIKWLACESLVPILMVGTSELLRFGLLSGQLGRRTEIISFNPYRYDEGPELAQFTAAISYLHKKLPLPLTFTTADHRDDFYEGSVGAIGILKPWFDNALHRAVTAHRRSISWEDFDKTRMQSGKLERIADEIAAARDMQRLLDGDRDRLRTKLGMKKPTPPRGPNANGLKPGQRKLERRPVGAGVEAA